MGQDRDSDTARIQRRYERERARREAAEEIAERSTRSLYLSAQALERSNEDLQRFAYIASHDLREPLRTVVSHLQLIESKVGSSLAADVKESLDFAVAAAKHLNDLVLGLLEYSRVQSGPQRAESIDADACLRQVVMDLESAIKNADAEVVQEKLPRVKGDPIQLTVVFQNILSNALKFRGDRPCRIQVRAAAVGDDWRFSVQDNGIGIAPEYHDQAFVLFNRLGTAGSYPGNGLGLAVCKSIVSRAGGKIWFESSPGDGSTFHFTFPRAE